MPKKIVKIQIEDEDAKEKAPVLDKKKKEPAPKTKKVIKKIIPKKTVKKVEKEPEEPVNNIELKKEEEQKSAKDENDEMREKVNKEIEDFEKPKEEIVQNEVVATKKQIKVIESSGEDEKKDPFAKDSGSVHKVISNLMEDDEYKEGGVKSLEKKEKDKKINESQIEEVKPIDEVKPRSLSLYRNIAYFFIFLVVVMLLAVLYFAFVKVSISIVPNQERISNNMIFDVYDKSKQGGASKDAIKGIVRKVPINYSIEYESTGAEVIGKEAVGEVTLINNYTKNQPLVATTRILSSDNKLFRIKETVNIPAGGSVNAEIYADDPSPDMAIGPSKFTIPGLWAGLQDKIYAESKADVIYRQKVKKSIVEMDIENGVRDLKQQLLTQAKSEINKTYEEYSEIIYKIDDNSIVNNVDGKAGDEVEKFSITMDADVVVVAFDHEKASDLAKNKFISSLNDNKELLSFDEENIIYSLNNYDYLSGEAAINATFEGKVSLKEDSGIVDKNKILGLKDSELNAYLSNIPDIAGYEVEYFPSFIKIVPKLADRIKVEIKK